MSDAEGGYIVLEFIRGPEVEAPAGEDERSVDSYREFTLNHILTQAQAVFRIHIVKRP
jgi:hypothetical protein